MWPRGCESRDGTPITLVLIHTNEGPHDPGQAVDRTAEDLAAYLDRPDIKASYHVIVDDDGLTPYLPDGMASWSAFSANHKSLNLCFTGWAHWARADWLAHDPMLRFGAEQVRRWCATYGIPAVKIGPTELVANHAGCAGHVDWTHAALMMNPNAPDSHTDPGDSFPWDVFLGYVGLSPTPTAPESSDMTWRLERTNAPLLAKPGDAPTASWAAVEDVISLCGPAGPTTWHGRQLCHVVFGRGGAFIQEAWWGPVGGHVVDPATPLQVGAFASLPWEAPAGARFLTLRYAAPAGGSVGIEVQH